MTGYGAVLERAAQVMAQRGLARGRYLDDAGRVDAAGAVCIAAGVDLDRLFTGHEWQAGLHPRYAADPKAALAMRAMCQLAAFADPAFGGRLIDMPPPGRAEPRLEALESLLGPWSDGLEDTQSAAGALRLAAQAAGREQAAA